MKYLLRGLSLFFLISCTNSQQIFHFQGKTMGTYYSIKIVEESIDIENTQLQIDQILKEVNMVFSTYIPNSEISLINKSSSAKPIEITPVMKELIKTSRKIYHQSQQYFDPTVGPLVNLWGFGPDGKRYKPSKDEIEQVKKYIGFDKVSVSENFLSKSHDSVRLDFSSIAKGQGVDDLALVLESRGHKNFLIEIGGEIRAKGTKPDRKSWKIGIEKPSKNQGQTIQKIITLQNQSIATSGSYRNYLKYGDAIFSHTISPLTGMPVNHKLVSVSVIDKRCAIADGWATALMALGAKKGLDIANQLGLSAFFLVKEGEEFKEISSKKWTENRGSI